MVVCVVCVVFAFVCLHVLAYSCVCLRVFVIVCPRGCGCGGGGFVFLFENSWKCNFGDVSRVQFGITCA